MNYKRVQFVMSAVFATGSLAIAAGAECSSLAGLKLPHTSITLAQSVAPGAFTEPVEKLAMTNGTYDMLPAFCRVAGLLKPTSDSNIRFEVWMPLENWNYKFQGVGNGGFAGYLPFPDLGSQLALNYATAGTDTGHIGGDASWAPGRPQKTIDFGYRAIHETAAAAGDHQSVLRGRSHAFLLQRVFEWGPAGADGGPAISRGLRRHHRRSARSELDTKFRQLHLDARDLWTCGRLHPKFETECD